VLGIQKVYEIIFSNRLKIAGLGHQITSRFTFGQNFSFWDSYWEIWPNNLPDHALNLELLAKFDWRRHIIPPDRGGIYLRCIEYYARYAIVVSVIWRMQRRHAFVIAWKKKKGLLLLADFKNKESKNNLPFGEFRSVKRKGSSLHAWALLFLLSYIFRPTR